MDITNIIKSISFWRSLLLLGFIGLFSFSYLIVLHGFKEAKRKKQTLPPGPRGLPLLGILPLLGNFPHVTLQNWAKQFGPVMYMKLGLMPTVVISSPKTAELVFKTHDLVFASRPISEVGRILGNNFRGMTFSPYGPYWRQMRKLCTVELLSTLKIESYRPIRMDEVGFMVRSLADAARAGEAVDLTKMVATLSRDITCRMVFGKKYSDNKVGDGGFTAVNEELVYLAGAFNISEFIPWLRVVDLQGVGRRMKAVSRALDQFFDKVIDEHVEGPKDPNRRKDFVDHMLSLSESNDYEFGFDRANAKMIMQEMLLATIDTTSTTIDWTLTELLKNQQVMRKAQEEIESVVGKERLVDESDLVKLDYLYMIVKETMRLHPAAPLLVPHECIQDCTLNGYDIPKGSRVIVNAWAIARDPQVWPDPLEFRPERFVGSDVDLKGQSFQLLPFGSGRRGCPGMQLGLTMVQIVVAQLIHCFNWELPHGVLPAELDMREKPGIVTPRAQHLKAIPRYRLKD